MTNSFTVPRANLTRAIDIGPLHLRPVYAAVRDHGCGQAVVMQHAGPFSLPLHKPLIAIIGDDTDCALGPAGFDRRSLERFFRACEVVAIVSSSADPAIYASAVQVAAIGRKHVTIIETRPEQEAAWLTFVRTTQPDEHIRLCTIAPAGWA